MKYYCSLMIAMLGLAGCQLKAQHPSLHFKTSDHRLDLLFGDSLITSYLFEDSLRKQSFYPIKTPSGVNFTRSFPPNQLKEESTDHPHHIGIWMTYGEVNEVDFWTSNWEKFDGKDERIGQIQHRSVFDSLIDDHTALFETSSYWLKADGQVLLEESSSVLFNVFDSLVIVDRSTRLKAKTDIHFKDSKEGMMAVRVSDDLREDRTGTYENSRGQKSESEVWGKQAEWVILRGKIDEKPANVLFVDHPKNVGYPTYWMARGYGLFAANPLGKGAYTNGANSLNFMLPKDSAVQFRYRMAFFAQSLSQESIDYLVKSFQDQ